MTAPWTIKTRFVSYHISVVYFATLAVMFVRNVVPYATNKLPMDAIDPFVRLTWATLVLLLFTGFVVPLALPRIRLDLLVDVSS